MNIVYFVNGQQIEMVCYEFIPKHEEFNSNNAHYKIVVPSITRKCTGTSKELI
jgi:hypothetical protein